jgi:archaeosortase B (VPXXXP-CTERM-specific)
VSTSSDAALQGNGALGPGGGATGPIAPPGSPSVGRIVARFTAYLAIVVLAYPALRTELFPAVRALEAATAALASGVLGLFATDVSQGGRVLVLSGHTALIVEECTGVYEILIYCAAVLAFPTSGRNRLLGFALGIPLIYAANVLRIATLLAVGRYQPVALDFLHLYLWQATLILMITGTWLLWIALVVRRGKAALAGPR